MILIIVFTLILLYAIYFNAKYRFFLYDIWRMAKQNIQIYKLKYMYKKMKNIECLTSINNVLLIYYIDYCNP